MEDIDSTVDEVNIGPYEKLEAIDENLLLAISNSATHYVKQPTLRNLIKQSTMKLALLLILAYI